MSQKFKTKALVLIDFDVNNDVKAEINRQKKLGADTITKEEQFGKMIEDQFRLEKLLKRKKMSFDELLTTLKATEV